MKGVTKITYTQHSEWLQRTVTFDGYRPDTGMREIDLLLVNDGQDMDTLQLPTLLDTLYQQETIRPVLVVCIHAGPQRKQEYGTAAIIDAGGRGARAELYTRFVIKELLPFLRQQYMDLQFTRLAFAGYSLGGLSALDIVWRHSGIFSMAGVFSGSLWWRSRELNNGYNEATDRIMHRLIRNGTFTPGMRFFFECGTEDEISDRNNNGIIDSIDDTKDLISELVAKGYQPDTDIHYMEIQGGRHDIPTWTTAMEAFLRWGWSK